MILLIDNGAIHNFIHQKIVDEPNLPISEGTRFEVTIGDRSVVEICKSQSETSRVDHSG